MSWVELPRILRFRLRLARFDYTVQHVPGKLLYTADTLSRAPLDTEDEETTEFPAEVEAFVDCVIQSLPATSRQLENYRRAQAEDSICAKVIEYCQSSWPEKRTLDITITTYSKVRGSITVQGLQPTYYRSPFPAARNAPLNS